ncbi:HNH endonuclease [Litchfieldia alkalitelluris]|uniref:HNH endonuclease n=1 Tax=Litchfieldia alkalitelluris TaxID=304268 RepID=UPI0014738D28|nr:HNH endonuclease [Litchfieldia alkalitelluris]
MEEWKLTLESKRKIYYVSDEGQVKSINKRNKNERLLKFGNNGHDYSFIKVDGKNYRVHILVAKAFIPNHDNKPEVNHIDRNRRNNKVINLEWCTHQENMNHAKEMRVKEKIKSSYN